MAQNLTSATASLSIDDLRKIEVFADLPREQLDWLAEHLQLKCFQPGEIMGREGDPIDNLAVILEGETQMQRGTGAACWIGRATVAASLPFTGCPTGRIRSPQIALQPGDSRTTRPRA
ncbi:MAG: cyclic nucleotide-binding domain-containing protein, partial [Terracidiphilus sp.]